MNSNGKIFVFGDSYTIPYGSGVSEDKRPYEGVIAHSVGKLIADTETRIFGEIKRKLDTYEGKPDYIFLTFGEAAQGRGTAKVHGDLSRCLLRLAQKLAKGVETEVFLLASRNNFGISVGFYFSNFGGFIDGERLSENIFRLKPDCLVTDSEARYEALALNIEPIMTPKRMEGVLKIKDEYFSKTFGNYFKENPNLTAENPV